MGKWGGLLGGTSWERVRGPDLRPGPAPLCALIWEQITRETGAKSALKKSWWGFTLCCEVAWKSFSPCLGRAVECGVQGQSRVLIRGSTWEACVQGYTCMCVLWDAFVCEHVC